MSGFARFRVTRHAACVSLPKGFVQHGALQTQSLEKKNKSQEPSLPLDATASLNTGKVCIVEDSPRKNPLDCDQREREMEIECMRCNTGQEFINLLVVLNTVLTNTGLQLHCPEQGIDWKFKKDPMNLESNALKEKHLLVPQVQLCLRKHETGLQEMDAFRKKVQSAEDRLRVSEQALATALADRGKAEAELIVAKKDLQEAQWKNHQYLEMIAKHDDFQNAAKVNSIKTKRELHQHLETIAKHEKFQNAVKVNLLKMKRELDRTQEMRVMTTLDAQNDELHCSLVNGQSPSLHVQHEVRLKELDEVCDRVEALSEQHLHLRNDCDVALSDLAKMRERVHELEDEQEEIRLREQTAIRGIALVEKPNKATWLVDRSRRKYGRRVRGQQHRMRLRSTCRHDDTHECCAWLRDLGHLVLFTPERTGNAILSAGGFLLAALAASCALET